MVDSFTSNRNLTQPLVGGDVGTWGGILNNGVMAQLDLILGATQAISITSADVTLSTAQWNNCAIVLTGALTGDHNLILPFNVNSLTVAVGGLFVVQNNTTGAHKVTVITAAAGSTGVTVPQGTTAYLFSDTLNVWNADSSKLQIIPWSGNPNGSVAGTAASSNNPPSVVWDYTNAILYFCITTGNAAAAVWQAPASAVLRGFDTAANLEIVATHTGGNLLNVALKDANTGNDPTAGNPIIVNFQGLSGPNTDGAPTTVNIGSALSMNTNATGASLGSTSNVPFRIWLAIFNNAGTPVLAMRNCSSASGIFSIAEYGVASTTSINGSATSAGVWYTPNGTTLTNCAFRVIGYLEYTGGLATAGTYTSDPNNTVLFGPGIKLPGDVVQSRYQTTTTQTTVVGTTKTATNNTQAITPTSACNLMAINAYGIMEQDNAGGPPVAQIGRNSNSTLIGNIATCASNTPAGAGQGSLGTASLFALDLPGTTSSTTYTVYFWSTVAGDTVVWLSTAQNLPVNAGVLFIQEIMG